VIAVDTNLIVRLLTRDDPGQYRKAHRIFQDNDVFIANTVILETKWVLRFAYKFAPDRICEALSLLFGLSNVHATNPVIIHQAIQWHLEGLDFADALHLAESQHCTEMITFDESFAKKAKTLLSCPVKLP
jgi:predicted nucleic-acid-binding protein